MTILTDDALEFARAHIEAFFDSDFFPKPDEYQAIWASWSDVKKFLSTMHVEKLPLAQPQTMPARKKDRGYRIVHQLEPTAAIVYTALAYMVAPDIEAARVAPNVAFAYRIAIKDGSFFGPDAGYLAFVKECRQLATEHEFVLSTDIADFYNRIYIHRIENGITAAKAALAPTAKTIEDFLMKLNGKASQGIPIGPSASIIMAEAVLNDVDQLLMTRGFRHTRYVDDIRIFASSRSDLEALLEELVHHLYEQHRLQLSGPKTRIATGAEFLSRLTTPEEEENERLVGLIHAVSDYQHASDADLALMVKRYLDDGTGKKTRPAAKGRWSKMLEMIERDRDRTVEHIRRRVLTEVLRSGLEQDPIDLGQVRHALRQARRWRVTDLAPVVLENFERLEPVLPEAMLYLQSLDAATESSLLAEIRALLTHPAYARSRFARHWVCWYLSSKPELLADKKIGKLFWTKTPAEWQMRAARATRNLALVRVQRSTIAGLGPRDRRAVVMASEVLPRAERLPWLASLTSQDPIEGWIIEWAKKQP